MLLSLKKILTEKCDYPSQPRSKRNPEYIRALAENIRVIGLQNPIIGYTDPVSGRFIVSDGGCRLEAVRQCGLPEILALDLGKEPTPAELLLAQASLDIHKQHLLPMDRARLWHAAMQARGCTAKQLAKELGVSDSLVGHYSQLLTLAPDIQEEVNDGKLEMSKACLIARQESDHGRQRELAALARGMGRDEFAAKLRQQRRQEQQAPAVRVNKIKIELASATVTVSGSGLTLDAAIDAVAEAEKAMKKGREQGLTAKTIQKISSDRAKAGG